MDAYRCGREHLKGVESKWRNFFIPQGKNTEMWSNLRIIKQRAILRLCRFQDQKWNTSLHALFQEVKDGIRFTCASNACDKGMARERLQ